MSTFRGDADSVDNGESLASAEDIADAVTWAEEWANKAEDSLVSSPAGGDEVDDYSALHWSNKSSTSASNAATSESNASTSASAASASETASAASAAAALASETAAGISETNAAASETAAGISETNAAASEAAAAVSESNAATSEANAATSEANAAATLAAAFLADGTRPMTGNADLGGFAINNVGNVDGRDVSADGTKLDGIESGATADQTKADIDALGINADQVDGIEASQFVRNDDSDTISVTHTIKFDSTAAKLNFRSNPTNENTYVDFLDTSGVRRGYMGYAGGKLQLNGSWSATSSFDITGNLTLTGTVDGRDVATDGAKLDGIESGATADQTAGEIEAIVNHDNLVGFVGNEHVDHSTISISAGTGLSGGGTIAANRTLNLDINSLTADASPDSAADYLATYDASAGAIKKVLLDNLPAPALGAASVGQSELKTTTGTASTSTYGAVLTVPGGQYAFMIETYFTGIGSKDSASLAWQNENPAPIWGAYANKVGFFEAISASGFLRSRYVQASPPYDLGDGEIPIFIYVMIDDVTGDILAVAEADDPPWAYEGPTIITPSRIDRMTGKKYRDVLQYKLDNPDWKTMLETGTPAQREATLVGLRTSSKVEVEIDQAYKNADKDLIPHPFIGTDLTDKTIVMIDPVGSLALDLYDMKHEDVPLCELFYDGYININTTPLVRAAPNGIIPVRGTWK